MSGLRDSTGQSRIDIGHDVELCVQWEVSSNMDFAISSIFRWESGCRKALVLY